MPLSGLFYMAAALCWIRSVGGFGDRPGESLGPIRVVRPGLYAAALGLFAVAMLSKSVAVTLPVALVIILWWKQGRVTWSDAWRIAPFFLVALSISLADLYYYQAPREFPFDYGFAERLLIAARALWFYAGKLVLPTDLAVIYPLWDIDSEDLIAWAYVIAAVGLAVLLWLGRHRPGRGPLAGAAFFAATLSPVLGFVDFGFMNLSLVAERYAYLAGIGVIAVLVGAAVHGAERSPNLLKLGASGVLVALLAVFGKLTWEQSGVYRNSVTFYNHILSLNPEAPMHGNLARALNKAGRPLEALAAIRIASEQIPDSANVYNIQGVALLALDRLEEAAQSFHRAIQLDQGHRDALYNMADTRRRQGRFAESVERYRKVLEIDPEFALAHAGLGRLLFHFHQYEDAAKTLRKAVSLRLDASTISTRHFLAETLRKLQQDEEAIARYHDVLEIDPEFTYAQAGIGYSLYSLERYGEALDWLERSVAREPESPAAADRYAMMGRACDALGRTEEAAEYYARALKVNPGNAGALDSFALLRFRQQRYEEALGFYETLVEIDKKDAQAHVNMGATLYNLGRHEEAARSVGRGLTLDPTLVRTEGVVSAPLQSKQ